MPCLPLFLPRAAVVKKVKPVAREDKQGDNGDEKAGAKEAHESRRVMDEMPFCQGDLRMRRATYLLRELRLIPLQARKRGHRPSQSSPP